MQTVVHQRARVSPAAKLEQTGVQMMYAPVWQTLWQEVSHFVELATALAAGEVPPRFPRQRVVVLGEEAESPEQLGVAPSSTEWEAHDAKEEPVRSLESPIAEAVVVLRARVKWEVRVSFALVVREPRLSPDGEVLLVRCAMAMRQRRETRAVRAKEPDARVELPAGRGQEEQGRIDWGRQGVRDGVGRVPRMGVQVRVSPEVRVPQAQSRMSVRVVWVV